MLATPATARAAPLHLVQGTAEPRPVPPAVYSFAVPALSSAQPGSAGRQVVAQLARRSTAPFHLVALTWAHGSAHASTAAEVRVRQDGGWTAWQQLSIEPEEGPAETDDATVRDGTEPLWVAGADGVQARVTSSDGSVPQDVKVVAIDPGTSTYDTAIAANQQLYASSERLTPARGEAIEATGSLTKMPYVITRRQWGADPALGTPCPGSAVTVKALFVHHTAGSNNYAESDSAAIVRGIYAYHTVGRGWCDVGYNFLVDRYGNIFEGRRGGTRKPVHGAHVGNYNGNSVGVGMMGTFTSARPTRAMEGGLVRLTAWRLGSSYRYAHGKTWINGHPFKHISGHRDAMDTSCPGQVVYDWLPQLRRRVTNRIDDFRTPIYVKWKALGGGNGELGAPFMGERWQNDGRFTAFTGGRIYWSKDTNAHAVTGPILAKFRRFGGVGTRLGYPVTDVWKAQAPGALRSSFEGGRIYWSQRTGAHAIYGPILRRFIREGEAGGRLGLPKTGIFDIERGRRQKFQHGSVTWDAKSHRTQVVYKS